MNAESEQADAGSVAVYGKYILLRTRALLPERLNLPADICTLVQKTYDAAERSDPLSEKSAEADAEAKRKWLAAIERQEEKAKAFLLNKPDSDQTIRDLICKELSDSIRADARVRDTDESIELNVIRKKGDVMTLFSDDTVVLGCACPKETVAKRIARDCLRLPAAMCHDERYDALIKELEERDGLLLPNWQESPWLKGGLILPFDENGRAWLGGYELIYDDFLGLLYKKEGEAID